MTSSMSLVLLEVISAKNERVGPNSSFAKNMMSLHRQFVGLAQ